MDDLSQLRAAKPERLRPSISSRLIWLGSSQPPVGVAAEPLLLAAPQAVQGREVVVSKNALLRIPAEQ